MTPLDPVVCGLPVILPVVPEDDGMTDIQTTLTADSPAVFLPPLTTYVARGTKDLPKGLADDVLRMKPERKKLEDFRLYLSVVGDCLRLDDELHNATRILKFTRSAAAISGTVVAYGILDSKHHGAATSGVTKAAMGATGVFGTWTGWEQYQARMSRNEWAAMQCAGVLKLWHAGPSPIQESPAEVSVTTPPCEGADVLILGCTPEPRITPVPEHSTEPVSVASALYWTGALVLAAVAWEAAASYSVGSVTLEWVWAALPAL